LFDLKNKSTAKNKIKILNDFTYFCQKNLKVMKKIIFISLSFILMALVSACGEKSTPEKASKYYNSIVKEKTNPIVNEYEANLINSFSSYIPADMKAKFELFKMYVEKTKKDLEPIEPYFGDASLIDGAKELLTAYEKTIPLYAEKVDIESLSNDLYTKEKEARSKEIMKQIDIILNTVNDKYRNTTTNFGKTHNFKIKTSDSLLDFEAKK
jgi:hypothetical protein